MATGKIIPSIRYKHCPEAIDWLARAFSFTPHFVVPGDQGEILHAQLTYGDAMIMLGSAHDGDDFGKLHCARIKAIVGRLCDIPGLRMIRLTTCMKTGHPAPSECV